MKEEIQDKSLEALEEYVIIKLYPKVFPQIFKEESFNEEFLYRKILFLNLFIQESHLELTEVNEIVINMAGKGIFYSIFLLCFFCVNVCVCFVWIFFSFSILVSFFFICFPSLPLHFICLQFLIHLFSS